MKNKLKSEIRNGKKFIAKNLNWEIWAKNLVTLKRSDGVKDEES